MIRVLARATGAGAGDGQPRAAAKNKGPRGAVGRVSGTEQTSSTPDARSTTRGGGDNIRVDDTVSALRALRYGAMDEATRSIALPPSVRASVSPTISALRWGAVGYGLVLSAPDAFEGSYSAVITLAVCLFITTWRTIIPIRLGSATPSERLAAYGDVVILALGTGFGGGLESPFIFTRDDRARRGVVRLGIPRRGDRPGDRLGCDGRGHRPRQRAIWPSSTTTSAT